MKPSEAIRRVRETRSEGGDAETTAWACATQLETDALHRIATLWLLESARNAERAEVRDVERASIADVRRRPAAGESTKVSPNREAIIANVERRYADKAPDERADMIETACAIDAAGRTPRPNTLAREIWESVVPFGIEWASAERAANGTHLRDLQEWAAERVKALHIDWKRELLAQSFTVNGVRVTWGDATVPQHKERASAFLVSAAANAEGAERHLKAVADMEAAGVPTLNHLVGEAALA